MNTAMKLTAMGCGSAMVNSAIERGAISAAVHNANSMFKYYNKAHKDGIYTKEQAIAGLMTYYNELKAIEHLANVYRELWQEKFSKINLQIEKFNSL